MADVSQIIIPVGNSTQTFNFKDATVRTVISNARGTYTDLDSRLDAIDTELNDAISRLDAIL